MSIAPDFNHVEVDVVETVGETNLAYCVKATEDTFGSAGKIVYLPKSQVTQLSETSYSMPQWLAEDKDLV